MQLLLTLNNASILPLSREALNIDTFVDDTYQNLSPREMGYPGFQGNAPAVSEDGKMVLFSVTGNKRPADDATRVFVRGTLQGSAVRGELKTASAKLSMTVGERYDVGPFKATLRSITDNGQGRQSGNLY